MGYIEQTMGKDEEIVYRASLSYWPLVKGLVILVPGSWLMGALLGNSLFFFLFMGVFFGGVTVLNNRFTEIAKTNKRLVVKTGILKTTTFEFDLSNIESVSVDQGVIGRVLNYGDVTANGSGGSKEKIKLVSNPFGLRKAIVED